MTARQATSGLTGAPTVFILAFPLNVYNVFTDHPLWLWLGISFTQTSVIIPLIIFRWGKGACCGWICSTAARSPRRWAISQRTRRCRMGRSPESAQHGRPGHAAALWLSRQGHPPALRIAGWALGDESRPTRWSHKSFSEGIPFLNYAWASISSWPASSGSGLYFRFSGRVWCRFACPLAALMHIYTRFSHVTGFSSDKGECLSTPATFATSGLPPGHRT